MYYQISRKFENWTEGIDLKIKNYRIGGSSRGVAIIATTTVEAKTTKNVNN